MPFRHDYSVIIPPEIEYWRDETAYSNDDGKVLSIALSRYNGARIFCDAECFAPGSIILTRSFSEIGSKAIASYQALLFDNEHHSQWSHIAILDSKQNVWDINPSKNVQCRTISGFLDGVDKFHVRNVNRIVNAELLDEIIAEQADAKYPALERADFIRYFLDTMLMVHGKKPMVNKIPPISGAELICSMYVDRIIREAFWIEPLPESKPPLALPGHFASSSAFDCVDIGSRIFWASGV